MIDDVIERIDKVVYGFDTSKLSAEDMKQLDKIIDERFDLQRQKQKLKESESDEEPKEIDVLRRRWIALQENRIDKITSKGLRYVDNAGLEEINAIYKKINDYQNAHNGR